MNTLFRLALLSFWLLPAAVSAHHSTSEYDQTGMVEFEAVITKKFWKNPHVIIHAETTQEGVEGEWALEGASVSSQTRRGITNDLINVGDRVRVAGYVSTRRENDMLVQHLLLPSGQELLLRGNSPPRWPEASLVKFQTGVDPEKAAAAKETADGIFRVWTWGRLEPGWWFFGDTDKFPLTDAALEQHKSWNEYTDNPQLKCVAPGMPATMGNPYPIQFVQVGDNIEIREEEFDVVRTIHMDAEPDPSVPNSHLGYSVGRWEDENTLAIRTANINWPYFNRVGVSQSEQVEVEERFRVDEEAGKLHYELTVTDPATLTEPYRWKALWNWVPGEEVSVYGCEVEN